MTKTGYWHGGDRRDFVVIDPHGGTYSLARRVDGAKAKDIRARMADLDAGAVTRLGIGVRVPPTV